MLPFKNFIGIRGPQGYISYFYNKYNSRNGLFNSYCPLPTPNDLPKNIGDMLVRQNKLSESRLEKWGTDHDVYLTGESFSKDRTQIVFDFDSKSPPINFLKYLNEEYPYFRFQLMSLNKHDLNCNIYWTCGENIDSILRYAGSANVNLINTFGWHI